MGSLHLLCGEKEATLKCEKDLSFNNFDQFVRLRFGIAEGTVITYFNENGEGKSFGSHLTPCSVWVCLDTPHI